MSRSEHNAPPGVGQLRPRTQFDVQFIIHVLPRLRVAIRLGAHMVRHEVEDFEAAEARVQAIARKLGRYHLDHRTLVELDDWIDCALLEAVLGPASPELITPQRLAEITGEPREAHDE